MLRITFVIPIGALAFALSLSPIALDLHSGHIGSNAAFAVNPNANDHAGHPSANAGPGGPYGPGGRFGSVDTSFTPGDQGPHPGGLFGAGGPLGAQGGGPSGNPSANADGF